MIDRGTGRTTKQLASAPQGAVYIWCNSHLHYPKTLARELGRGDLRIERPSWLDHPTACDTRILGLVVDHAACLTERQRHSLAILRARGIKEAR